MTDTTTNIYDLTDLLSDALRYEGYEMDELEDELPDAQNYIDFIRDNFSDYVSEELLYELTSSEGKKFTLGGKDLTFVTSWGGEGDGAQFTKIFLYEGRYFKAYGYYSSWDSDQWEDDIVEVSQIQKIVTRYVELGKQ